MSRREKRCHRRLRPPAASMPSAERVAVSGLPVTGSPDLCWKIRTARRVAGPTTPVTWSLMPSLPARADCRERMVSESAGHWVAGGEPARRGDSRSAERASPSPECERAPEKWRPRASTSSSFDLGALGLVEIFATSGLNRLAYLNRCSTLATILGPRLVCDIFAASASQVIF